MSIDRGSPEASRVNTQSVNCFYDLHSGSFIDSSDLETFSVKTNVYLMALALGTVKN